MDSGASHSFVTEELVRKHGLPTSKEDGMRVTLADGSQVESSQIC